MKEEKIKELSYYEKFKKWLVKGTVSEPWATKEEIFNNPEVQKKIDMLRKFFPKNQQEKKS